MRTLRPCPGRPGCASSQASAHDPLHRVEPLGVADGVAVVPAVLRVVARLPGGQVLERDDVYVHARYGRVRPFAAEIELLHDVAALLLHVRTASLRGRLEADRERVRARELLRRVEAELRGHPRGGGRR